MLIVIIAQKLVPTISGQVILFSHLVDQRSFCTAGPSHSELHVHGCVTRSA